MIIAAGRPRRSVLVRLGVLALAAGTAASVVATGSAQATTAAPDPVGNLRVTHVYDHTVAVAWTVPSDSGGVVARLTVGYTAAPTPTAGYAVQVNRYTQADLVKRPLLADTEYTFALWVRSGDAYSARRSVSVHTQRDVTPPHPVTQAFAYPRLSPTTTPTGQAQLYWQSGGDIDDHGVRILRTSSDWAHAVELAADYTTTGQCNQPCYRDTSPLRRDSTYYYYIASRDSSGLLSPYVKLKVVTNVRRVSGTYYPYDDSSNGGSDHALPYVDSEPEQDLTYENPSPAEFVDLPGDTGGQDQKTDFHIDVQPGHYTVCEEPDADPEGFSPSPGACWNGHGEDGWSAGEPIPADAKGATVVTDHDVTGITLD